MNRKRKNDKIRTAASDSRYPFSKHAQINSNGKLKQKKAGTKKEAGAGGLQESIDALIDRKGLVCMRIHDGIGAAIKSHPYLSENEKTEMLKSLAGWADNNIVMPIDGTHLNLMLSPELKSKTGFQQAAQRRVADRINVPVVRSVEQVETYLAEMETFLRDSVSIVEEYREEEE